MKKISIITVLLVTLLVLQTGCKKEFLETKPSDSVASATLFESYENARALIVGTNRFRFVYDGNTHQFSYGERSATGTLDYLADDFFAVGLQSYGMLWSHIDDLHCEMTNSRLGAQPWNKFYLIIDNVNQLIAGYQDIAGATELQKSFLYGQALVYRAHMFHLLVQMYAQAIHHSPDEPGIMLNTSTTGEPQSRATVAETYVQIEEDLINAINALAGTEGLQDQLGNLKLTFASQAVAKGLLSRVYLCKHDWANAAKYANEARQGVNLMTQTEYANGFLTQNQEWMWASIVSADESDGFATFQAELTNGAEADMYPNRWSFDNCISTKVVAGTDPDIDCRFGSLLVNCRSGYSVPVQRIRYDKYRGTLSAAYDLVYMRGAEMLLNEAEALCMQGGQDAAVKTLLKELIAARVDATYANKVDAMLGDALLEEVKMQRRIEFWGEGVRFFDLKRRGESMDRTANGANQANYRTKTVNNPKSKYWIWYIPESETRTNTLCVQNNYTY